MPKKKNIFISHVGEDADGVTKLNNLLKNNGIDTRDYSVSKDNPNNAHNSDYIKQKIINPRIDRAGTLLVYITKDMLKKDSEFVDHEIKRAAGQEDMRIIGVWAHGESQDCDIPEALDGVADAVVGWTGNSIIDAIEGKLVGYYGRDGVRSPDRTIEHIRCQ